jgi:citrate synthase
VTDSDLDRGLEGVTVAETRLSRIDGEAGELVIGGFPVEELASKGIFPTTDGWYRNGEAHLDALTDADDVGPYVEKLR